MANVQSAVPIGKLSQSQDPLIVVPKRLYYLVDSDIGEALGAGEAMPSEMMILYHRYPENYFISALF
jgi:hypothetical protein